MFELCWMGIILYVVCYRHRAYSDYVWYGIEYIKLLVFAGRTYGYMWMTFHVFLFHFIFPSPFRFPFLSFPLHIQFFFLIQYWTPALVRSYYSIFMNDFTSIFSPCNYKNIFVCTARACICMSRPFEIDFWRCVGRLCRLRWLNIFLVSYLFECILRIEWAKKLVKLECVFRANWIHFYLILPYCESRDTYVFTFF